MKPIALVLTLLSSQLVGFVESWRVTLYEDKDFGGRYGRDIEGGETTCVNLEHERLCDMGWLGWTNCIAAADQASSVNTHDTCIRVYRLDSCKEKKAQIEPGTSCHANWDDSDCGFNDDIRSISGCSYENCLFPSKPNLVRRTNDIYEMEYTRDDAEVIIRYRQIGIVRVQELLQTHFVSIHNDDYAAFGSRYDDKMAEMDALTDDVKGHLVASSLGGPAERWNLVPQTDQINNGDGSGPAGWKSLERQIKSFVQANYCHNVLWQLVIGYGDENRPRPRRPLTFNVSAEFYYGRDLRSRVYVDCDNNLTRNVCITYGTRN